MTPLIFALVLMSAAMHAGWNAMLRGSTDRTWTVAWIGLSTFICAVPFTLFTQIPPHAIGYALASAVLHVVYLGLLAKAYTLNDLSTAYPVARGSSPLLVSLGGWLFAGERPTMIAAVGILMVALGILAMGFEFGHISATGIGLALIIGATIATYTVIDALGVRAAPTSLAYNVWSYTTYGLAVSAWFAVRHGVKAFAGPPKSIAIASAGGVASMVAYAIVTHAMRTAPMGYVSALRETSVMFAALLGWLVLGEPVKLRRAVASVVVAIGAGLIGFDEPSQPTITTNRASSDQAHR